jgi:hypothetical protein
MNKKLALCLTVLALFFVIYIGPVTSTDSNTDVKADDNNYKDLYTVNGINVEEDMVTGNLIYENGGNKMAVIPYSQLPYNQIVKLKKRGYKDIFAK